MRVLAAEDDLTSRLVLEAGLRQWGYDVISACDGNEAWTVLQAENAPKLAVLDWLMPGMDGVEVCRRIRERDAESPIYIILLTTLGRKQDIVAGLKSAADDYVTKPFDNDELRARIQVGQRVVELRDTLARRVEELQAAISHIRTLQGILPICMHCHKIRDDQQSWQRLELYIQEHSDAQFSHSLCPECLEKYYPKPQMDESPADAENG
jgi:DNA-binding response OmpR family regulator